MAVLPSDKTASDLHYIWRQFRSRFAVHPLLIIVCVVLLAPVMAIAVVAAGPTDDLIPHLLETVLGRYVQNTILLMAGVGMLAIMFGVSTAWLVSRYDFAGRTLFEWLLVLPAAMPAYIIAYSYTDFFEYAGPIQSYLRDIFGWQSARDYWFPEIRSFGGAMLIMASVLYPYIYLLARTSFRQTSANLFEIAEISGQNLFWQVGLPMARPAIIAGLSLVLMEVVSDFGTVEYFALETLTLGIFNVWIGMNSKAAAAQLALCAFVLIGMLLIMEIFARSRRSFQNNGFGRVGVPRKSVSLKYQIICIAVCSLPIFIGFGLPVAILLNFVLGGGATQDIADIWPLFRQSFGLAFSAAVLVITLALVAALLAHYRSSRFGQLLAGAAAAGYAFPGTILAIGVLAIAGYVDHVFVQIFSTPVMAGSFAVLLFGLLVRFHAVGYGSLVSGIKRMPPHMMESGLIMGYRFPVIIRTIILPLLRNSIIAGGLLVFVDVMKELPMTLLLRPFSFETFATYTYQFAKDEMLEVAAIPALLIVCAGLLPVYLANRALEK